MTADDEVLSGGVSHFPVPGAASCTSRAREIPRGQNSSSVHFDRISPSVLLDNGMARSVGEEQEPRAARHDLPYQYSLIQSSADGSALTASRAKQISYPCNAGPALN